MRIRLLVVGKTDGGYLREGIEEYSGRLRHYARFDIEVVPDVRNAAKLSADQVRQAEGGALLSRVSRGEVLVLLDECGIEYTSRGFADWLSRQRNGGRDVVFAIGGPYGFCEAVYARAEAKISLSRMTMTHQMVRLVFLEQLYRAHTILAGQPYHHD